MSVIRSSSGQARLPGLAPFALAISSARGLLAVPVGYLAVLTGAAWYATLTRRRPGHTGSSGRRIDILVPAHDEEMVISDTITALLASDYPDHAFRVHVLADHCTDATAAVAVLLGAHVQEFDGVVRGKGPVLAAAIERLVAADEPGVPGVDAFVIVDADTIVAPDFLRGLDRAFQAGATAVQGQYRVRDPGRSTGAGLRAAALALRHHVRPLGRTTLGASSGLFGNGMAFTPELLTDRTWSNHLTEDIELQMELLLDGTLVAYAPDAVVEAQMPATLEGARTQNERWERGRLDLARRYLPVLGRRILTGRGRDRVAAIDAALDHLVPPLSVLVVAVGGVSVLGAAISTARGVRSTRMARVLPAALAMHVVSGLVLGRLPWSVYRSLLHAPAMVLWKVRLWARMLVARDDVEWVRTARANAST